MTANSTEAITRLQAHKNSVSRQEHNIISKIHSGFGHLAQVLASTQQKMIAEFKQQMLNFHEKVGSLIKNITSNPYISHQNEVNDLIAHTISIDQQGDLQQTKQIIQNWFKVSISKEKSKGMLTQYKRKDLDMCFDKQGDCKMQALVQKMQRQRDYFQRKDQQKLQRIRQLQGLLTRRGINIKEMSKTYLEEKCSKWALERVSQQKKILVQKIGETSQEAIRLEAQLSQQKAQVIRLTQMLNQGQGSSFNAGINSSLAETQILQAKNQELRIRLTEYLHRYQQQRTTVQQMEGIIFKNQQKIQWLQEQLSSLQQERNILDQANHRLSKQNQEFLQEKQQILQKINSQKQQLKLNYDKNAQENELLRVALTDLGQKHKQLSDQLRSVQNSKSQTIYKLQCQIKGLQEDRDKFIQTISNISTKHGQDLGDKQTLKQQIARLMQKNKILSIELQKTQLALEMKKQQQDSSSVKIMQIQRKAETSGRENKRLQKKIKQLQKETDRMQIAIQSSKQKQSQAAYLQEAVIQVQKQMRKLRQLYERRNFLHQKTVVAFKQKFTSQISVLLNVDAKQKTKKGQGRVQLIQKYIQEMAAFSDKNAFIKQLKDENKQLKEGRDQRSSKKSQLNKTQDAFCSIQSGVLSVGSQIYQQKLKCQTQIYEQQLLVLKQNFQRQNIEKNNISEQLLKARNALQQLKTQQRQDAKFQEFAKISAKTSQKLTRCQQQIKRQRMRNKKLQSQIAECQQQLRVKKQLISGLKKESKQAQQILIQKEKQMCSMRQELDKLKRRASEANSKEILMKQFRERSVQLENINEQLLRTKENLEQKIKLLNHQVNKKEDKRKQMRSIESKFNKVKQNQRIRDLQEVINQLKDKILKNKLQIDRKDDIIKSLKSKLDSSLSEATNNQLKQQQQLSKAKRESDTFEKKYQSVKASLKKQQFKTNSLSWCIKKIYELCCNIQKEAYSSQNKQYITRSSASTNANKLTSSNAHKLSTPSNLKGKGMLQGLSILNLRPQDLQDIMAQTTMMSNRQFLASPIMQGKQETLLEGLQQLERILNLGQLDTIAVMTRFKKVIG